MSEQAILEAAAHIIREKGYHAASISDIAEAVSLSKASLYHYFERKQEILKALLDQALDALIERILPVIGADLPADEKFRQALFTFLDYMSDNLHLSSVLLLEYRSLEPEYREAHIPRRDEYEDYWEQILLQGLEEGIFDLEDSRMAVKVVLGVASWTVTWLNPEGRLSAAEIADYSASLLLDGFYKRPKA
jgi:AcrR family transcriptional regulator